MWNPIPRVARTRKQDGRSDPALPSIEDLLPDASEWREDRRTGDHVFWRDAAGDSVSFHRVPGSGELPLNDPRAIVAMARAVADSQRGTSVSAEVVTVAQHPAIQIVSRVDEPPGGRHAGILVIPLDGHTDTVCIEAGGGAGDPDAGGGAAALDKVRRLLEGVRATWRPGSETPD